MRKHLNSRLLTVAQAVAALSVVATLTSSTQLHAAQQEKGPAVSVLAAALSEIVGAGQRPKDSIRVDARLRTRDDVKSRPSKSNPEYYTASADPGVVAAATALGLSTGNWTTEPRKCPEKSILRTEACPFRSVTRYIVLSAPDITNEKTATVRVFTVENSSKDAGGNYRQLGGMEQVFVLSRGEDGSWRVIAKRSLYGT